MCAVENDSTSICIIKCSSACIRDESPWIIESDLLWGYFQWMVGWIKASSLSEQCSKERAAALISSFYY